MTDNEIIEAYGCCNLSHDECGGCDNCPLQTAKGNCLVGEQEFDLEREIFNLLNRQKAEIERLKHNIELLAICKEDLPEQTAKAIETEAIKEFIKRFEKKIKDVKFTIGQTWEIQSALKEAKKEMVGETE